jgi:TonB family protein
MRKVPRMAKRVIPKLVTKFLLFFSLIAIPATEAFAQEQPKFGVPLHQAETVSVKGIFLAKPDYPPMARAMRLGGQVSVIVTIDEDGNVVSAKADSGHPVFHKYAEEAAIRSKFTPAKLNGLPVKVTGRLNFNFVISPNWEEIGSTLAVVEFDSAAISYKGEAKEIFGEGLPEEAREYETLTTGESFEGKGERAEKLINSIQVKLEKLQPIDAWYFKLGVIESRLQSYASNAAREGQFKAQIQGLLDLYNSIPNGIPALRTEAIAEALRISQKAPLTDQDKAKIGTLLVESYNKAQAQH